MFLLLPIPDLFRPAPYHHRGGVGGAELAGGCLSSAAAENHARYTPTEVAFYYKIYIFNYCCTVHGGALGSLMDSRRVDSNGAPKSSSEEAADQGGFELAPLHHRHLHVHIQGYNSQTQGHSTGGAIGIVDAVGSSEGGKQQLLSQYTMLATRSSHGDAGCAASSRSEQQLIGVRSPLS